MTLILKLGRCADLLQSVESRLVEENKALVMERSHLSDLMANVQKMQNDVDRSSENDRRRLESQVQLLENQRFVAVLSFRYPGFGHVMHGG
jgi:regulator of replication initiation timing